jgi:hypothetical protein
MEGACNGVLSAGSSSYTSAYTGTCALGLLGHSKIRPLQLQLLLLLLLLLLLQSDALATAASLYVTMLLLPFLKHVLTWSCTPHPLC